MGIASSLFFNPNNSEAQTLYRKIYPTDIQLDEQISRKDDLQEFLKVRLKELSDHPISSWLQGSYKFGTQIRPIRLGEEYDIDLGIYYCWDGKETDREHNHKELKGFVQKALIEYAAENSDDVLEVANPSKERCGRIRFRGAFHIDIPCYHLAPETDKRMLATEKRWENSDPKKFYLWFKEEFPDAKRAKVRRCIQFIKCWAALKFTDLAERPSSILLTVLVANAFKQLSDEAVSSDDEALFNVVDKIIGRLEISTDIENPQNRNELLNARYSEQQMQTILAKFRTLKEIGQTALKAETKLESAITWALAFEHFFPMPEEEQKSLVQNSVTLYKATPIIKVTATGRSNSEFQKTDIDKLGPIPQDCDIDFEITNSHLIPDGAIVHWYVRNQGDDAEYVNDLGHYAGRGVRVKEHSAYNGRHYMDCVIYNHNRIIGFKRVPITIQGMPRARRNPVKIKNYRSIGRR